MPSFALHLLSVVFFCRLGSCDIIAESGSTITTQSGTLTRGSYGVSEEAWVLLAPPLSTALTVSFGSMDVEARMFSQHHQAPWLRCHDALFLCAGAACNRSFSVLALPRRYADNVALAQPLTLCGEASTNSPPPSRTLATPVGVLWRSDVVSTGRSGWQMSWTSTSAAPSAAPILTSAPSVAPTAGPTTQSAGLTHAPTVSPSALSVVPTGAPSSASMDSVEPSVAPSVISLVPTGAPSSASMDSFEPSVAPSVMPTTAPTSSIIEQSSTPSSAPSFKVITALPSAMPTRSSVSSSRAPTSRTRAPTPSEQATRDAAEMKDAASTQRTTAIVVVVAIAVGLAALLLVGGALLCGTLVALPLLKQARLRSKRAEIAFVQHEIVNPVQSALRAVELAGVQGRRKSEIDSDMAAYVKEGNWSQG